MTRMISALLGLAILALVCTAPVAAWDDCPKGYEDGCSHHCFLYTDTNGDGICDHSQEEPASDSGTGTTSDTDTGTTTETGAESADTSESMFPDTETLLMPLAALPALLGALAFLIARKR